MQKEKILKIECAILVVAIGLTLLWGHFYEKKENSGYNDGITNVDLDTINLVDSDVQVDFSEVILSKQGETRKLIVSTQEATVSTELTDSLIKKLDFDFLKKTQTVSYMGKGYFVVDLDDLTKSNIVQDDKNKVITIKINHAYLQTIEIDPDNIIIDEVKEGLLARGKIKLTVSDYNTIEKELRSRMEKEFNTAANGQKADTIALKMVKGIYEPLITAIDPTYELNVEFK